MAVGANEPARIAFHLPLNQTTIRLVDVLPALARPGLVVDGTTQPGYDASKSATAEIAIGVPVVEITSAPNKKVFRGLTVVADGVTIRGLSLYGFTGPAGSTLTTPPADIFIAHRNPPPSTTEQQPPFGNFPFLKKTFPRKRLSLSRTGWG